MLVKTSGAGQVKYTQNPNLPLTQLKSKYKNQYLAQTQPTHYQTATPKRER